MAEERLGASFSIDTSSLKTGLAQANRLIRESESEFKSAAAGMDDWSESQEGLEARIKHLNNAQDLQKKKVEALKKEYKRLVDEGMDETSKAAVEFRTNINKEQAALNKTEKELKEQTDALKDLQKQGKLTAEQTEKLDKAMDGLKSAGKVAVGAIAAVAAACVGAATAFLGLAESTRETRTALAKVNQSFDTAGLGAENAEKTVSDLYGVLGDTDKAVEASSLLAKMSKDEADLQANTRILTGVFAEFGDSIPTEGLAEGMQATAKMGEVQGVLADALEWQGINLDEYNEKLASMSSEEERAAYIQETLTGLYGESADAYRENNKAIIDANAAQLEYEKSLARLGEKAEPITTKIREGFTKILDKILELINDIDMDAIAEKIEKAFDDFVNNILPAIVSGLQWIIDNKDYIIAGVAGIGAAFIAWKAFSIISAVTKALKGMTIAQAALNLVMNANPIGLIVTAIAGLVTAFVVLWKKCEGFRNFWKGLWDGIKSITKGAINFMIDLVNGWIKGLNLLLTPLRAIIYGVAKAFGTDISFDDVKIPTIPKLAEGGVVKGATMAMIGEDGAEAVVPLEKNKQWIKEIAKELADQQPQRVVVNQTNNYSQAHSRLEIYKSKQATANAVKLALGGA